MTRKPPDDKDLAVLSAEELRSLGEQSIVRYGKASGPDLTTRFDRYLVWQRQRAERDLWPYFRRFTTDMSTLAGVRPDAGALGGVHVDPGTFARVHADAGTRDHASGLNFASQDYLSLSTHPYVREAAIRAVHDFGTTPAGSAVLGGSTSLNTRLEQSLAATLGMAHIVLFPTGWSAAFGTLYALLNKRDHVVLDDRSHESLRQGAAASGADTRYFAHLDNSAARAQLAAIRAADTANAVLVVTEGLFSMDSDAPRLAELLDICREFGARLLVDVAHDLGCTGPDGGGQLAAQNVTADFVIGSFSKALATTGGFFATTSASVHQGVRLFGGPQMFSAGLTPAQVATATAALEVIRSPEGHQRRTAVADIARHTRAGLSERGHHCVGNTLSPIIPVLVGGTAVGRFASGLATRNGLIANLVEPPAVPADGTRFRLAAMADHTRRDVDTAVEILHACITAARDHVAALTDEGYDSVRD